MAKYSVVIPLIPQHDREMGRIFHELRQSRELLEEIIICRSESLIAQRRIKKRMLRLAKRSGINSEIVKFSFVSKKATAGENRNRGWNLATGSHVAFMDADDSYATYRLSIIDKFLVSSGGAAAVHNIGEHFQDTLNFEPEMGNVRKIQLDDSGNFSAGGTVVAFHYAHLTLETSLRDKYQYTDIFPGEDLELVKRMTVDGVAISHFGVELSHWNRKRSFRYEIRRLRKRIFSFKFR